MARARCLPARYTIPTRQPSRGKGPAYGLRPQSLKLAGIEPAIPDRVLQPLMAQECGASLEIGPANKIEAAGMAQHMRMHPERREIVGKLQPIEHFAESRWLQPEHAIGRPQSTHPQRPQEPRVVLRKRVLARLRSLEPADHDATLLPRYIGPSQVAKLAHAQPVIERDPYGRCIPSALSIGPRDLNQHHYLVPAQMLAWPAIGISHPGWRLCPIHSVWRGCLDQPQARSPSHVLILVWPITAHSWDKGIRAPHSIVEA